MFCGILQGHCCLSCLHQHRQEPARDTAQATELRQAPTPLGLCDGPVFGCCAVPPMRLRVILNGVLLSNAAHSAGVVCSRRPLPSCVRRGAEAERARREAQRGIQRRGGRWCEQERPGAQTVSRRCEPEATAQPRPQPQPPSKRRRCLSSPRPLPGAAATASAFVRPPGDRSLSGSTALCWSYLACAMHSWPPYARP